MSAGINEIVPDAMETKRGLSPRASQTLWCMVCNVPGLMYEELFLSSRTPVALNDEWKQNSIKINLT